MREPLPKELVTLAWNASVGYSRDSACSQRFVTQAGTCAGFGGAGRWRRRRVSARGGVGENVWALGSGGHEIPRGKGSYWRRLISE